MSKAIFLATFLFILAMGLLSADGQEKPKRTEAEQKAIAKIQQQGGLVMEIAQNDPRLEVSYQQRDQKFSEECLLPLKDLKDVMKHVIDRLDHQMLNDIEPFTSINPSAENLAKYFYDQANARLKSLTNGRVAVGDVTIWETDTTTARYSE